MNVTFSYRNMTYSTADPEPTQLGGDGDNVEVEMDEAPVDPTQENGSGTESSGDIAEVEVGDDIGDIDEAIDDREEADDDANMADEILVEDVEDENTKEFEAPLLNDHTAEPGGPARRTRSATANTGRKYFWRLEDGKRMRNEHQFLADWEIGEVFTHFTLNKGLKALGSRAEKGVVKELFQFVDKDVLHPISIEKLTKEKMRRSLRLIMLVKKKRDGTVKDRGCCDGSGQRGFIDEFDATSPTVSTEAQNISCAIDAYERREVMTVDIP